MSILKEAGERQRRREHNLHMLTVLVASHVGTAGRSSGLLGSPLGAGRPGLRLDM